MRRTFVPLTLAAWMLAAVAGAQLSQSFQDFPKGPAGFLMTDGEKKAYAELKTDAEAQAWVDLFWARRDPDLNTVQNEFKLDFDMRVQAADAQFSYGKVKGSMSDRGKVLILMGKPLGMQKIAAGRRGGVGRTARTSSSAVKPRSGCTAKPARCARRRTRRTIWSRSCSPRRGWARATTSSTAATAATSRRRRSSRRRWRSSSSIPS